MNMDFDQTEFESQLAEVATDILVSNLIKSLIPKGECESEIINKIYNVFRKNGISPITSLEILKDLADSFAETGETCGDVYLEDYIKPTFKYVGDAFAAYKELQEWFDTKEVINCLELYKICKVSLTANDYNNSNYKSYGFTKAMFDDFSVNACADGRYILVTKNPINLN